MKRKFVCSILAATLLMASLSGCKGDQAGDTGETSTLEPYSTAGEAGMVTINNEMTDLTGDYQADEQELIKEECMETVEGFLSTAFTMDPNTSDYTDELSGFTDNTFGSLDMDMLSNMYPVLDGLDNTSFYKGYDGKQFVLKGNTEYPQAGVMGFAIVEMDNKDFPDGEYAVYSQFDLINTDGDWKIARFGIDAVFDAGSYETYAPSTDSVSLTIEGKLAGQFDFIGANDNADSGSQDAVSVG